MAKLVPELDAKAMRAWKEAEAEQDFWKDHYQDLLKQYPEQFVAVRNGEIVAVSESLENLVQTVGDDALRDVWIKFITADPLQHIH